jgi:hypothetical protein
VKSFNPKVGDNWPYTPLTDEELGLLSDGLPLKKGAKPKLMGLRAAAEIRALRAQNAELFARNCEKMQALSVAEAEKAILRPQRDDLLAALRPLANVASDRGLLEDVLVGMRKHEADSLLLAFQAARAAIARAEGRAA